MEVRIGYEFEYDSGVKVVKLLLIIYSGLLIKVIKGGVGSENVCLEMLYKILINEGLWGLF